jgi:hypothetical protein
MSVAEVFKKRGLGQDPLYATKNLIKIIDREMNNKAFAANKEILPEELPSGWNFNFNAPGLLGRRQGKQRISNEASEPLSVEERVKEIMKEKGFKYKGQ